ncbi:helix-turn-helix domain-containing protein [Streptomyces sp. NPDC053079]|uniref:helix-turn-helix domain-containing protein n=1 Tax=Streptomyces sp. NPDC053079 TaxID=3365697 RepID=UPI0037D371F7
MGPEARRRALQARIHDYIRQRLRDPGLTPEAVAASHGISTRHLYALFRDQGLTVGAWIRERRLENCRRDLADPLLLGRPIHSIAAGWGFPNPADFSRTFRAPTGSALATTATRLRGNRRAPRADSRGQPQPARAHGRAHVPVIGRRLRHYT